MYNMGLSNGTIAGVLNVFLHDKGKKGSFSPASISNMTSKYTKELDLLSDVSPDMTQAERTIALLNKWVIIHYCFFTNIIYFVHSHLIPTIIISPILPDFVVGTILSVIAIHVIMIWFRWFLYSFPTLYFYLRQGISHVCLTISPKGGLVLYKNKGQRLAFKKKGRPTLEERKVLDCSK